MYQSTIEVSLSVQMIHETINKHVSEWSKGARGVIQRGIDILLEAVENVLWQFLVLKVQQYFHVLWWVITDKYIHCRS